MLTTRRSAGRARALVVCTALAGSALASAAPPAAAIATGPVVDLGLTTFSHIVVDDAHRQVFLSGGPTASSIEVRGFDGSLKTTITGQPGASGMALSQDQKSLYVALDGSGAVSRIDTATRTEAARFAIGRSTCVSSVAVAGVERVFVGYGCGASAAIAELQTTAPTGLGTALAGTWGGPVHLDGEQNTLAAVDDGQSVSTLRTYLVNQTPIAVQTLSTATAPGSTCHDLAVDTTGTSVGLACEGPAGQHRGYQASTLTVTGSYATSAVPVATATPRVQTQFFAGSAHTGAHTAPDVYAFSFAGDTNPFRKLYLDNGVGARTLVADGLAASGDGQTVFAVSAPAGGGSGPLQLHVFTGVFVGVGSAVNLTAPAIAARAVPLTISGSVTGSGVIAAGTSLTVTKVDLAGTHVLPAVTTDALGSFVVHDTPDVGGTNTYTVAFAGDAQTPAASASKAVAVSRVTPVVTVATNASSYAYNGTVTVTAHLGPTFTNRSVKVVAQPLNLPGIIVASGRVNSAGNIVGTFRLTRRSTISVVFTGDFRTAPKTVTKTVAPRLALAETMSKHYATSGAYYLYRTTANPTLTVRSTPAGTTGCVRFVAQRFSAGAWRPWATLTCAHWSSGVAAAFLAGSHPRGYNFRMRVETSGDKVYADSVGAWKYFRFP